MAKAPQIRERTKKNCCKNLKILTNIPLWDISLAPLIRDMIYIYHIHSPLFIYLFRHANDKRSDNPLYTAAPPLLKGNQNASSKPVREVPIIPVKTSPHQPNVAAQIKNGGLFSPGNSSKSSAGSRRNSRWRKNNSKSIPILDGNVLDSRARKQEKLSILNPRPQKIQVEIETKEIRIPRWGKLGISQCS